MGKHIKIVITVIMIIALICSISNIVFARPVEGTDSAGVSHSSTGGGVPDISGALQKIDEGLKSDGGSEGDSIAKIGKSIVGILQVVGIVVAVVIILILGIKYLIGSAGERAEYKKTMTAYLVGAILIFASTTIVKVVYDLVTSIKTT